MKSKPNIVIVDYISEKNRGDAAIHLGLINLIRQSYPDAALSAVTTIGANQLPTMKDHYDQTRPHGIEIFGGLVPTYYPTTSNSHKPAVIFEVQNLFGLFCRLWLLAGIKIKIPIHFLNRFLPKIYRESLAVIQNADLILIRGRNYRGRRTATLEVIRILSKIYHLLLCGLLSKKMGVFGASIWDQKSNLAGRILGRTLNGCDWVTVREKWSLNAAKKMSSVFNFPEPILIPDLSFAAFETREGLLQNRKQLSKSDHPEVVGITIHDWKTEGQETRRCYLASIIGLIKYLSDLNIEVKIIPQVSVPWEDSSKMRQEILRRVESKNLEVIQGDLSVQDLLQLYSNLDILIATRMHSAIFAAAVNTPIVAIPYDQGGKWGIIKELGYGDYLISYSDVTPEILIGKTELCWQNKIDLIKTAQNAVEKNIADVQELVNLFKFERHE